MENDWLTEQKKKDEINKLVERAARNGNLTQLMHLTTCENYKGIADAACGWNYPLKGAALSGHIHIIDFLVNFPDEEKRNEIIYPSNIVEAIEAALQHGKNEVYLFFKKNNPDGYKEFIENARHNRLLDSMTMRGLISSIQLLANDVVDKNQWDYNLFINKSVQYNRRDCFEYFWKNCNKDEFNIEENLIDIAHTALYNERFEFLDKIMKDSNLNLNEHITINNFAILVEVKFDSLKHVVEKYDYKPNKKLADEINNCLSRKEDNRLTKELEKFLNLLEKHELQKEIRQELFEKPIENQPKKAKI